MTCEVILPIHIYLANRLQPSPGAGVYFHAKWVAYPQAGQAGFCTFFYAMFATSHDNTVLSHLFLMELCLDDSSVITNKARHLFDL
jgi:hypothetical protein